MRLITLNTWGGRAGKQALLEFFSHHRDDTDVFCLQEIWSAPYEHFEGHTAGGKSIDHSQIQVHGMQEISEVLSEHTAYFRPHFQDNYGLLTLVPATALVQEEGEVYVYKHKDFVPEGDIGGHARNIQFVTLQMGNRTLTILNFHGLWNGKGKSDSEDRLLQSEKIIEFIQTLKSEYILAGDFNLLPDTQSIALLEEAGMRNLIKDFGIQSTRTSLYDKPEKYADYIFTSSGIEVTDFQVLPDQVSDHAPLQLDFAIL